MVKPCPDCGTGLKPTDRMSCEKANLICPECAPDFVVIRATSYHDIDEPTDKWADKYIQTP